MRYQIKGKQINLGEALQKYVRDELENVRQSMPRTQQML